MDSREGRFLHKINDKLKLVELFLSSDRINEASYDDILVRQELLEEIWDDIRKHDDAVRANKNIDDYRLQTEQLYLDLMGKVRTKLRAVKPEENDNAGINFNEFLKQQSTFLNSFSTVTRNKQNDVKLPPINIPPFSGSYHDWPTFENLFLQIHNDGRINKIRKFQYLKGLMIPNSTPDDLIKHFSVTEQNYDEAWQLLRERFNKRRHIVTAFVKKFIEQPSATQLSVTSLRHVCDTTENVIRGLRAVGPEAESRDPFLIYLLLDKIDDETKHLWARESTDNDNPTVNDLLQFLSKRCDALETVQSSEKKSTSIKSHSQSSNKYNSFNSNRLNTFVSNAAVISCPKCNQQHMLYECAEFKLLSTIERQNFVSQHSLCFNCMKPGHRSNVCRAKYSCHKCNKRHHTLIHLAPSNFAVDNSNASGNALRAHPAVIDNPQVPQSIVAQQSEVQPNTSTNQPNFHISSFISNLSLRLMIMQ